MAGRKEDTAAGVKVNQEASSSGLFIFIGMVSILVAMTIGGLLLPVYVQKNTITDGGVAPQCTFARPTQTHIEHIDTR